MHRHRWVSLIVLFMILLAGSAGASAWSTPVQAAPSIRQQTVPRIEKVDCSTFQDLGQSGATVECGYLVVPENRQNPSSRTIEVAYALIRARGPNPQPDPVVYLAGGPGGTAISGSDYWASLPVSENRDLLLVDPRGLGYSRPRMECPALALPDARGQANPPTPEERLGQELAWAQSCRDLLAGQGFDLTAYNSLANANDLHDLRQLLGYAEWNLWGTSYGTRTALGTMAAFPQGIRSVILDSVVPPQLEIAEGDLLATTGALDVLFAECQADPACDHDYPDLETRFNQTVQRLDQHPVKANVLDGQGNKQQVWVTGADVVGMIKAAMLEPARIQILPLAMDILDSGDKTWFVVDALSDSLYTAQNRFATENQAIYYTVLCHDAAGQFDAGRFWESAGRYPALESFYRNLLHTIEICKLWGAGDAGPAESQPVVSDIPTLLLVGGYDPVTAPAAAGMAAATLSRHYLYEFPAYSHAAGGYECPQAMMAAFLDDPSTAPDSSCMAQIEPLPFVTDVYVRPGSVNVYGAVQFPDWQTAVLGIMGVLFLSALISLPIMQVRSQAPSGRALSNAARWMFWTIALLNLAFGASAWLLVKKSVAENYGWALLFGFSPASARYLMILPWLTAVLTAALVVLAFPAWKNRWWGRVERVYWTVGVVAAIGCTGFWAYFLYLRPWLWSLIGS